MLHKMVRSATTTALLPPLVCLLALGAGLERAKQPKCKVIPLQSRAEIRAAAVFSGTVVSFLFPKEQRESEEGQRPLRNQLYAARVVVKRVFKGDRGLRGRSVVVGGLGNPKICISRPRLGDARISVAVADRAMQILLFDINGRSKDSSKNT